MKLYKVVTIAFALAALPSIVRADDDDEEEGTEIPIPEPNGRLIYSAVAGLLVAQGACVGELNLCAVEPADRRLTRQLQEPGTGIPAVDALGGIGAVGECFVEAAEAAAEAAEEPPTEPGAVIPVFDTACGNAIATVHTQNIIPEPPEDPTEQPEPLVLADQIGEVFEIAASFVEELPPGETLPPPGSVNPNNPNSRTDAPVDGSAVGYGFLGVGVAAAGAAVFVMNKDKILGGRNTNPLPGPPVNVVQQDTAVTGVQGKHMAHFNQDYAESVL